MRGQNTAEKHQNKTDLLQELDQRVHYSYSGPNNYNLKKKPFHQVQQYTDQYTKRLLPMSLMKIAHDGLRKALQVFGNEQTKPKQTIKRSFSASGIDFSNILAKNHNYHLSST